MHIRSEKHAFPRRSALCLSEEVLQLGRQDEEVGEGIRHAEELDRDLESLAGACIACQPLGKRETDTCPLCDA